MHTFREYSLDIPNQHHSKGIARKDMPQIADKHHDDFIKSIRDSGILVKFKTINPKLLKPTQKEFSTDGIMRNLGKISTGTKKPPVIISKDGYIMDGHHRWAAHVNAGKELKVAEIALDSKTLLKRMHDYEKVSYKDIYNEAFLEESCDLITRRQMKEFETLVDRLFKKFNIDFEFTKHFGDRMGDERNRPCIKMQELAELIKKIYAKQGRSLKAVKGAEAVVRDLQTDLNIPVVVKYDSKNDEFDVVAKTIMRKKGFKTQNRFINY